MASGFHKAFCSLCNRETWHYKMGDKPVTCSDHSNWTGRKHTIATHAVQTTLQTIEPPTEREIRIANRLDRSMWRIGEHRKIASIDISDEAWAAGLFDDAEPVPQLDPDKLYCSFCGDPVEKIRVTQEKKPVIRRVMETYKTEGGDVIMQEKVTSRAEEVNACPKCCLKIRKPIEVRRV